ncbi:hypothetical protein TorRG33x02_286590 [Trema orientale]|uniref:Uncharacterized protein n=1 Tax=Trema orientale TaxID=63057 RepID=A0A2P5CFP2_TREOI|nr:hypothetical protein TorRG33x02_286590 [Trema orientale]
MSVLRRNDIGVDADSGLGEELTKRSKLLIGLRSGSFLSELRRRLGGDGRAVPDGQKRGFWGNTEKFGVGTEFVEDGERDRDEAEVARVRGGRRERKRV